ncbi:hypothetical protein SAMN02745121_00096 [Nannocystis exedens]|uniref:Uncharacterized protein n=1 Tax=Nannocystis exedens TaxID=54 RepID=A0A1I1SKE0_9BACT|nr:hypothetical protein [Nannocystis exedens]PCC75556.1 hypothetical protein NAEX_08667 [Nannocystis exedens]SFD46944.1 hypothetical protein SAMN02745121_00096 [Nannocystis exedens]
MTRPVLGPVLVALSLTTAALSCVLPDIDIEFEETAITNRNAVRIIEPVLLSIAAEVSCDPNLKDMLPETCPQPGDSDPGEAVPHFLDPTDTEDIDGDVISRYAYCTCPDEQKDSKSFDLTLYVEDQDEEPRPRKPKDSIFAALLLDVPQDTIQPFSYVDYLLFYDPERPLDLVGDAYRPAGRRDPQLRQLVLGGDQGGIDLCNGGRERLSKGFHTLTVMVTDRAWFKPEDGARQYGVPDIDNGATYDSTHYVFHCDEAPPDAEMHPCQTSCVPEKEAL